MSFASLRRLPRTSIAALAVACLGMTSAGAAQAQTLQLPKDLLRPPVVRPGLAPGLASLAIAGTLVITGCRDYPPQPGALTIVARPVAAGGSTKTATAVRDSTRWTYRIGGIGAGKYVVQPNIGKDACQRGGVWRPPTETVDLLAGVRTVHFVFYGRDYGDDSRTVNLLFRGCQATTEQARVRAVDSSGRSPTVTFRGINQSTGSAHFLFVGELPPGEWEFRPEILGGRCAEIGGEWHERTDSGGEPEFVFVANGYVPR